MLLEIGFYNEFGSKLVVLLPHQFMIAWKIFCFVVLILAFGTKTMLEKSHELAWGVSIAQ